MEIIRRKLLYLLGGVVLLFLLAIGLFWAHLREKERIAIGGKGSEGEILSEIIAQLIEHDLRIPVKRECQVEGTLILFEALKANQIDLYVEYTGTALTALLRRKIEGKSPSDIFDEVKKGLHAFDIIAFPSLGFQNRYAVMMNPEIANQVRISTLSDLSKKGDGLKIRFDQEFCAREEYKILEEKYQIPLSLMQMMDHILLYLTLQKKGCDVINGYTTDGFCKGLKILEDDKSLFPSYEAIPIVRKDILNRYPGLKEVLRKLEGKISMEEMQEMNYKVERNGELIYNVAKTFLNCHTLI